MRNQPYLLSHYTAQKPTISEGIILRDLIDRERTTHDRLIDQIYGHREDGGPLCAERCLYVFIFHLRRKLHPWWGIHQYRQHEIYLKEN